MRKLLPAFLLPSAWDIVSLWNWIQPTVPVLLSGSVAVSGGVYDQLPLMWVIVGTTVTFAAATLGLVAYSNYLFQRDPEYKFKFVRPFVWRSSGWVWIGFEVRNDSLLPVGVYIETIRTSCSERTTPTNRVLPNRLFELAPGDQTFYSDVAINIANVGDNIMNGRLELSVSYGHPGNLRYKIRKDLDLSIPFDTTMNIGWANNRPPGNAGLVS